MINFKGEKKVDYYFEGNISNESKLTKTISPGQWDIFCSMPHSPGSLYSIELKSVGKASNGPAAKKGLATLSTDINNNIEKNDDNKLRAKKNINNDNNSIYNEIFKEEGEALDDKGYVKQYVHPVNSTYYVGFENSSHKAIEMNLTLTGLYEKSNPSLEKIIFTANPMTRRVFSLNFKEGHQGDISFMFDKN